MAQIAPAESRQGELFGDDHSPPDANDDEPVFWSEHTGHDCSADDFVQDAAAD